MNFDPNANNNTYANINTNITHYINSAHTTTTTTTTTSTTDLTPENLSEFIGEVVNIFEDYLEENSPPILLYNEDREEAIAAGDYDDPEEAALIYGEAYDWIGDEVRAIVDRYDLYHQSLTTTEAMTTAFTQIMEGFEKVLHQGQWMEPIPKEDQDMLGQSLQETFSKWKLYSNPNPNPSLNSNRNLNLLYIV
jgi:hypothetical protein